MKLGTRLLLPLLATVAGVMLVYAIWAVRQRESTILSDARRETSAYATALGIALEIAYRNPMRPGVQEAIDRLSRAPAVYGVVVYEPDGTILYSSDPLQAPTAVAATALADVLAGGGVEVLERELDGIQVLSVLHPITDGTGVVVGAFEVVQPLADVQAVMARVRHRFILNTLTLLAALTVVILWLVRRYLTDPLRRFVEAVHALGRGELATRIDTDAHGGELDALAVEFNNMAGRLQAARGELLTEAERRVALARRVREVEKMAAVGNVVAGVAHEIAAPMNVIRGRAELLLRRDLSEAEARNARIIADQIERITRIVRDLLDYARRREPRLRPVELRALTDGVLEFVEAELERAAVQVVREGDGPCWAHGDPELLERVFLNLIMNGLQALEHTTTPRSLCLRVTRVGAEPSASCVVEISDSGPGVPVEEWDQVFKPYYTTRGSGGGTGLGLALARSIIVEHGGRIAVDRAPEPWNGALFRIDLPAAPAPEQSHG